MVYVRGAKREYEFTPLIQYIWHTSRFVSFFYSCVKKCVEINDTFNKFIVYKYVQIQEKTVLMKSLLEVSFLNFFIVLYCSVYTIFSYCSQNCNCINRKNVNKQMVI